MKRENESARAYETVGESLSAFMGRLGGNSGGSGFLARGIRLAQEIRMARSEFSELRSVPSVWYRDGFASEEVNGIGVRRWHRRYNEGLVVVSSHAVYIVYIYVYEEGV